MNGFDRKVYRSFHCLIHIKYCQKTYSTRYSIVSGIPVTAKEECVPASKRPFQEHLQYIIDRSSLLHEGRGREICSKIKLVNKLTATTGNVSAI